MKTKIYFILFIFSTYTHESEIEYHLQIDNLFSQSLDLDVKVYCPKNKSKNLTFRGRPENIENIMKNNKYNSYSAVYINRINTFNISKFPASTIFFINIDNIDKNMINQYKEYCFVESNNNYNFENYKYYYVSLYINLGYQGVELIIIYLVILFAMFNILFILIFYCFYNNLGFIKIYANYLAYRNLYFSISLSISCSIFQDFNIFGLIHSIFKSILIMDIIYLLKGYNIIYFRRPAKKKKIFTLLVILVEIIGTLFIIYSNYFFYKFRRFYLFLLKTLIEHIIIIVIAIKMFKDNFVNLYKQYRLERRIRTVLTLSYKYKLIIYSKVYIYSFLYSVGFIIMNFIILFCSFSNDTSKEALYIYLLNSALELFFIIIFAVLFFPIRNSIFYYFEVNYDFNSINFVAQIKSTNEINMKISNLKQKQMKEEYLKHEYPLVLVEPFTKTDNLLNEPQIHIGIVKRN